MAGDSISWARKEAERILQRTQTATGDELIHTLFGINMPAKADHPTPKGYRYVPYEPRHIHRAQDIKTVAYHAHPGDISADFGPFHIERSKKLGEHFRQVIATRGEKGTALPEKEAIALRQGEEANAAALWGIDVNYLRKTDGSHFPDGELLMHQTELTDAVKRDIIANKPGRVLAPSPWPDHPDHVAMHIAVMNALEQLRGEDHFLKHGKIEVITFEPQFGIVQGQTKSAREIPGHTAGYGYHVDADGLVQPAPDTANARDANLPGVPDSLLAISPFMLSGTYATAHNQLTAFLLHGTQAKNETADYLKRNAALLRLRGRAVEENCAVSIYPQHIPGVTLDHFPFLDNLPEGFHAHQLKRVTTGAANGL